VSVASSPGGIPVLEDAINAVEKCNNQEAQKYQWIFRKEKADQEESQHYRFGPAYSSPKQIKKAPS
jgi:hypothetical protein